MDRSAMAERCPHSTVIGPALLRNHDIHILQEGYASVAANRNKIVYGLLWNLSLRDVAALDAYENVAGGLYRKVVLPVSRMRDPSHKVSGSAIMRALVYKGAEKGNGIPSPDYLNSLLDSAAKLGFPASYRHRLRALAAPSAEPAKPVRLAGQPPRTHVVSEPLRDEDGLIKVRPRFQTPFDRK